MSGDEPTDHDLIVGHPFWPVREGWEDTCGHRDPDGWICGYSRGVHADQGKAAAPDEGDMAGMEHDDWPEGTVMGGEDDFTPWEGDLALAPSCGKCGALVADVEAHHRWHTGLVQEIRTGIREAQRRGGWGRQDQIR